MENQVILEAPWSLSLQHNILTSAVKSPHSPVASASESFMKDWYTGTKRKEEIENAENVLAPIVN